MAATKKQDEFDEDEAQVRFELLVRAALNTKPKPLKSMEPKGMPSQSKKQQKQKRRRRSDAA